MNAAHLRDLAVTAALNAYIAIDDGLEISAYEYAKLAGHYANLALERERVRDSLLNTIIGNQHKLLARQAMTLRCDCGGKLKQKKLHRELVGVECARCGRHVARPAQGVTSEDTNGQPIEPLVPVQAGGAAVQELGEVA